MSANELNYKRLKLLGEQQEPKLTLENMATILERSYSGFLKALEAGTIYAHEISVLAERFNMSVEDVFSFLGDAGGSVSEPQSKYIKKKKLQDTSDPLEWVRLAMTKSSRLDDLIEGNEAE